MKKTCIYLLAGAAALFASCNGTQTGTTTADSSKTTLNPGDSSVTTTTTTTVVHHRYSGSFAPQPGVKYMDLKTHKEVTVKIDTDRGIVNSETNEPIQLIVMPTTHDTIYGQTGTVVNNYVIKEPSGDYTVDTVKVNSLPAPEPEQAAAPTPDETAPSSDNNSMPAGKMKEKDKNNKTKIKAK